MQILYQTSLTNALLMQIDKLPTLESYSLFMRFFLLT